MKTCKQGFEIITPLDNEYITKHIERCGRICYKSESNITDESAEKFIRGIIKRGHESVIEHYSFSVKFITDRSVTHEIVRHRIASYSQESQRYVKYAGNNELTFIEPSYLDFESDDQVDKLMCDLWRDTMLETEVGYNKMLENGATPEKARAVLPNSTRTEIIMTANLRSWRNFMKLRTDRTAHPQIRELSQQLLMELKKHIPVFFEDFDLGYKNEK
ncbi:MAG: FAD-dependent thymidylate synthase [bacterium]